MALTMLATYYSSTNTSIAGVVLIVVFAALVWAWGRWGRPHKPHRDPFDEHVRVPAWQIIEGDMVDLEDDPYADPTHDPNAMTAYEHFLVGEVEQETPDCVVIHFDGGSYGFPTNHKLRVRRH